jgi:O-antigen ligase
MDKRGPSPVWYLLLSSALGINGILSLERILNRPGFLGTLPTSSPVVLGFIALLGLFAIAFYLSPLRYWIYITALMVPIEVSVSIGPFPKYSPIDYIAAISGVVLLIKLGPRTAWKEATQSFPFWSFLFFSAFLVYGVVAGKLLGGNPRPPLRWGEFLYFYSVSAIAVRQSEPEEIQRVLSNLLCAIGALISIIVIFQFAASSGHAMEAHATFGHRNVMAAFLSISLPAASAILDPIDPEWTPMRKTASFLMLCAFIMSYSRGAWMGLTFGVLFVLWRLRKNTTIGIPNIRNALLIILMLIGPLGVLLIVRNPERGIFNSSQRPLYWAAAVNVLSHRPLTGLGPGNYDRDLPSYLSPGSLRIFEDDLGGKRRIDFWQHLHNLYLQIAVDYGVIGFVLWAVGLGILVRTAYLQALEEPLSLKPYFVMSIIAFLVHNTVDLMTVSSLDILVAFFLALTIHPTPFRKTTAS